MTLETNLNVSPYFDDSYSTPSELGAIDKNYHRVLFRPGYAVQARELTQMQTILQNQIERFANKVVEDGKVISGISPSLNKIGYVKLQDRDANNRVILLNDFYDSGKIGDYQVFGQTSGVVAELVDASEGSEAAAPNYLSIFVKYIDSGANATTKTFADDEVISIRTKSGNTYVSQANTITSDATGNGLRLNVSDGIVYHKGHFIRVESQGVMVAKYETKPSRKVGFETRESIVDSNADSKLLDNATGSTNHSAPGANRLKLNPVLSSRGINTANTTTFFPIAFIEDGTLVQSTNRELAGVNALVSKRIHDINGDFAVKPFNVRIREHKKVPGSLGRYTNGDINKLVAQVEPGIGYVGGNRIELLESVLRPFDKATTTESEPRTVTQNYGSYIICDEVKGAWDVSSLTQVDLYDTAQNAITNNRNIDLSDDGPGGANDGNTYGTKIGHAYVRGVENHSGALGTPNGLVKVYLFGIKMYNGNAFWQTKSLFKKDGTATGVQSFADRQSNIQESGLKSLVFPFSQKGSAIYQDGETGSAFTSAQFVYRQLIDNSTLSIGNETVNITVGNSHAGGSDSLNEEGAIIEDLEKEFIVIGKNAVTSDNKPGTITVSGTSVTGTANLADEYNVGEWITYDGNYAQIAAVSGTSMTLETAAGDASGVTHARYYQEGHIFDFSTPERNMTGSGSTLTLDFNETFTTSLGIKVIANVKRTGSSPAAKVIRKSRYVEINTNTHTNGQKGPWSLGVPDALRITAVYKGTAGSVTTSDTDVTNHFKLNSNQKEAYYDLSKLEKNTNSSLDTSNVGLLVKFDYFEVDDSAGAGYFTVDSYPIGDDDPTASNVIASYEIPTYRNPRTGATINLRDAVDFRAMAVKTATPNATASSAPTNPGTSLSFHTYSNDSFVPAPGENFQATVEYYLPRKDRIILTKEGTIQVIKGNPSLTPRTPETKSGAMTLATLNIPVYPSMSPYLSNKKDRTEYGVTMNLENNKRYTMKDLRTWDERVKRLEYYTTLNSLQNATTNKQIIGDTGLDRFKNGIFADSFTNFNFIDTTKEGFAGSIDRKKNLFRPAFKKYNVALEHAPNFTGTQNITTVGNSLMLDIVDDSVLFVSQPYASKLRNAVQDIIFNWSGDVILDPPVDNRPSTKQAPDIQINITGVYDAIVKLAERAGVLGFDWGDWETLSDETKSSVIAQWGNSTTGGTTTQWTRTVEQVKNGTFTSVDPDIETFDLGTTVENVAVREYMMEREIKFTGVNMRPKTRVYAYFDDEPVSDYCIPTNSSFANTIGSTFVGVSGKSEGAATALGDELYTNAEGKVYGRFLLPEDDDLKFRVGTRKFKLVDIDDYDTKRDLITTSAHGDYTSIPLDVITHGGELSITVPTMSTKDVTDTQTLTTITTRSQSWDNSGDGDGDPLAQTFSVSAGDSDGVFVTKVGLFFGSKSEKHGFRVEIREVENGFPTRTCVPFGRKWLDSADIVDDSVYGSEETIFEFDSPVFLSNSKEYAMVLKPGAQDKNYSLWVGGLGSTDVLSNELIAKPPHSGVLLSSSNDRTWSPIQKEDLKFNLYKAKFTTSSATAFIQEEDADYLKIKNTTGVFKVGEKVYNSTNERGFVKFFDPQNNLLYLERSTGNFGLLDTLTGKVSGATTTLAGYITVPANVIVPKIPAVSYSNTSIAFSARTTSAAGIGTTYKEVTLSTSNEFRDSEKAIHSASNNALVAVGGSNKTLVTKVNMSTDDPNVTPIIDLSRMNAVCVHNIVNDESENEQNTQGTAAVRYISNPIELEEGQDAEDLKVWVTGYKPVGSDIKVYARIHNSEDGESIDDKDFTPMIQLTSANTFSDSVDDKDYKEFEFGFSANTNGQDFLGTTLSANSHARLNTANNEVVAYMSQDGEVYHQFKSFAIKIVMTSNKSEIVPICSDVRAIALQK